MELLILNSSSTHMQISDILRRGGGGGGVSKDHISVNSLRQARVLHSCVKCKAAAQLPPTCDDFWDYRRVDGNQPSAASL